MNIEYVEKYRIYPLFGKCYPDGRIEIQLGLPQIIREFVVEHELFHKDDRPNWIGKKGFWNFFRMELLANFYAAKKYPFGFFVTLICSLTPSRLVCYWRRMNA